MTALPLTKAYRGDFEHSTWISVFDLYASFFFFAKLSWSLAVDELLHFRI